jgi:hypothetical protein
VQLVRGSLSIFAEADDAQVLALAGTRGEVLPVRQVQPRGRVTVQRMARGDRAVHLLGDGRRLVQDGVECGMSVGPWITTVQGSPGR